MYVSMFKQLRNNNNNNLTINDNKIIFEKLWENKLMKLRHKLYKDYIKIS